MADLEGFRAYARLDEDDLTADIYFNAAVGYGEAAGVPPMEDNPLYDMFVYAVALHFYDNRGFSPSVSVNAVMQSDWIDRWITALKIQLESHNWGGGADGGA